MERLGPSVQTRCCGLAQSGATSNDVNKTKHIHPRAVPDKTWCEIRKGFQVYQLGEAANFAGRWRAIIQLVDALWWGQKQPTINSWNSCWPPIPSHYFLKTNIGARTYLYTYSVFDSQQQNLQQESLQRKLRRESQQRRWQRCTLPRCRERCVVHVRPPLGCCWALRSRPGCLRRHLNRRRW